MTTTWGTHNDQSHAFAEPGVELWERLHLIEIALWVPKGHSFMVGFFLAMEDVVCTREVVCIRRVTS